MFNRRELFAAGAAAMVPRGAPKLPAVIATWDFGRAANAEAWKTLSAGGSALDAVEKGVNQAELDPENTSVGYGGLPNEEGETTLDAVIMWGPEHRAGAVGAIREIRTPISVARKVLEKTRHTFLVGEDATRFAERMGFARQSLETPKSRRAWEAWKKDPKRQSFWTHDTIAMLAIDREGRLCAGCSTSGLAFKLRGRVGDSPIVGAGAYCDQDVGAAGATGNGDWMMRFCPSYQAVEFMRQGLSPAEACAAALRRITRKGVEIGGCLIGLNRDGEFGAARIGYDSGKFPHAVRNDAIDEVRVV
jgi:N4-(beta-N-acetylglucosaminyl)-L-asparaginase